MKKIYPIAIAIAIAGLIISSTAAFPLFGAENDQLLINQPNFRIEKQNNEYEYSIN